MKRALASLGLLAALAACHMPPDSAFYNRGGPEALLDVSSEVVNLSVASPEELKQLSGWIAQDQPSRAELYCTAGTAACEQARALLEKHKVPVMMAGGSDNTVALVYERILARDCNPRFVDTFRHDNYNASPPSFGCATSANIVQSVSDKQAFVNPNISDESRATGAVDTYKRASTPPAAESDQSSKGVNFSLVNSAKSE